MGAGGGGGACCDDCCCCCCCAAAVRLECTDNGMDCKVANDDDVDTVDLGRGRE